MLYGFRRREAGFDLDQADRLFRRGGQDQLFLTLGTIVGPLPLAGRLALSVGAGYQFAVAPAQRLVPALLPVYQHNFIITTRLAL